MARFYMYVRNMIVKKAANILHSNHLLLVNSLHVNMNMKLEPNEELVDERLTNDVTGIPWIRNAPLSADVLEGCGAENKWGKVRLTGTRIKS